MIFVLVNPITLLIGVGHQLVSPKPNIHKCIDECGSQILARRINGGTNTRAYNRQHKRTMLSNVRVFSRWLL